MNKIDNISFTEEEHGVEFTYTEVFNKNKKSTAGWHSVIHPFPSFRHINDVEVVKWGSDEEVSVMIQLLGYYFRRKNMTKYQLEITVTKPFTNSRDAEFRAIVDAANAIEMRWSEYFTWEDDAQESLSRSSAIRYAEEEIQSYYPRLREHLSYSIKTKEVA
jgi:hypothetical protein